MSRDNLNSLFFAAVVVFAVMAGGTHRGSSDEVTFEQKTETTSFSASIKTASAVNTVILLPPNISATAVLVRDWSVAEPIFSKSPDQQWPIASLTKFMTAVVAREQIPDSAKIKMSETAIATEGSAGNFLIGGIYSPQDLLKALLKFSSNDAAAALAEHYGNEKFLEAMNKKAEELGLLHTRFFDPTGLSPLNQSILGDLEKLVVYIFYNHPEILEITREKEGNIHPFVDYPNFVGGKTGFIDEASGNLISLFNYEGRPLLIIVLGSEDRYLDTLVLYNRFTNR